jgi:hypothetical protein
MRRAKSSVLPALVTAALLGGCNVGLGDVTYTGGGGTTSSSTGTAGATTSSSSGDCTGLSDDEFTGPKLSPCWQIPDPGSFAQLEVGADGSAGMLVARPASMSHNAWFDGDHGPFLFQDVQDDFIVVARIYASHTGTDLGQAPTQPYNTAGLLVRDPAGKPTDENWLLYDIGFQGEQGVTVGTMVKVTTSSVSHKLPESNGGSHAGTMAICRYKNTFQVLRHLYNPDGVAEVASLPPETWNNPPNGLQVGLVVGTYDASPDVVGRFDYARYGVPTSLADCLVKFQAIAGM